MTSELDTIGSGDLLPQGLSDDEYLLLKYWSDPLDSRKESEVAHALKVAPQRVRELRMDKQVVSYLQHALEAGIRASRPSVMKALMDNAITRKDTVAQKMLLEIMGSYKEQHEIHTTTRGVFLNLTDEELLEKLHALGGEIDLFHREEKEGRRVFGSTGYSRHTYPEGPAGKSRRAHSRTHGKEGVD
jgi:hypothetical protein